MQDSLVASKLYEYLNSGKSVVIYGAGGTGKLLLDFLKTHFNTDVICFLDRDSEKIGTFIEDIEVRSPSDYEDNSVKIIVASIYIKDIYIWLENNNFTDFHSYLAVYYSLPAYREAIELLYSRLSDSKSKKILEELQRYYFGLSCIPPMSQYPQYVHPRMSFLSGDIILDGGAHNGDTVELFLEKFGQNIEIYAFEPMQESYHILYEKFCDIENVHCVRCGLWIRADTLQFQSDYGEPAGSSIVETKKEATTIIDAVAIDDFNFGSQLNFIKMDIEGAEYYALQGASKTIANYQPNLAICIYHKPDDWINIPSLVMELLPQHNIYLGHHSDNQYETVLYVLNDEKK